MKQSKLTYACALCMSVLLWSGVSTSVHAQEDYSQIFIFGDSLSDSGNVYLSSGETSKAPYDLVPSYPYAIGGHHFSNGKTWAERFAQSLSLNNSGKPSLGNSGKNGNYAFGGARARPNSGSLAPDSGMQIDAFLWDYVTAPSDALYVIQFGGNDIRDALFNPLAAYDIIQGALNAVATDIQDLYAAGARNFLVANSPNLAHAPAVKLAGPQAVAGAQLLSDMYNGFLEGILQQFQALPGTTFYRLDMAGFIDGVVDHPDDYGLTNVGSPCLIFWTNSDAKCENPEEYLFWDGIHPTAAGHNALADVAIATISGN